MFPAQRSNNLFSSFFASCSNNLPRYADKILYIVGSSLKYSLRLKIKTKSALFSTRRYKQPSAFRRHHRRVFLYKTQTLYRHYLFSCIRNSFLGKRVSILWLFLFPTPSSLRLSCFTTTPSRNSLLTLRWNIRTILFHFFWVKSSIRLFTLVSNNSTLRAKARV